jgi:hypothetical protein
MTTVPGRRWLGAEDLHSQGISNLPIALISLFVLFALRGSALCGWSWRVVRHARGSSPSTPTPALRPCGNDPVPTVSRQPPPPPAPTRTPPTPPDPQPDKAAPVAVSKVGHIEHIGREKCRTIPQQVQRYGRGAGARCWVVRRRRFGADAYELTAAGARNRLMALRCLARSASSRTPSPSRSARQRTPNLPSCRLARMSRTASPVWSSG